MGSSIYHCLCELRYLLLRRFMQKQTIEYTTANADSAPSTYFGTARVCRRGFGLFGTQPTEIRKEKELNYSQGFAVARSDRFT